MTTKDKKHKKGETICELWFNPIDCRGYSYDAVYVDKTTYSGEASDKGHSLLDISNTPNTLHDLKLSRLMHLKYLRGLKKLQERIRKEFLPQFECHPISKDRVVTDEEISALDKEMDMYSIESKEELDNLYYT